MSALSYLFESKQNLLYSRHECYSHKRVRHVGCIKEYVYVYVCVCVCDSVRVRAPVSGPNPLQGVLQSVEGYEGALKHVYTRSTLT